ncbi:MAG: ATPase P [Peptococcaceae bacterium]|jgi:soluble P-type ATPase|nr:ATPase P [Peptococcaceae bacterium]MDH7524909.1 ATPase P [Peptococcaceae bacterium]
MLEVDIPGLGRQNFEILVLDYNGTLALDGMLLQSTREALTALSDLLEIHILTSDTFGTVQEQCKLLPVTVHVLKSGNHAEEKAQYLNRFAPQKIVAIGNGANDRLLIEKSHLGIVVMGPEGCSARTLQQADVVVSHIDAALGLLLNPKRLAATLRC